MATIPEISANSHYFFIKFLFILFILFAVVNSAPDLDPNPSSKMASETLFSDVPAAASDTHEFFHPRKRENSKPRSGKKDESVVAGDEHEVPSGPNPISN